VVQIEIHHCNASLVFELAVPARGFAAGAGLPAPRPACCAFMVYRPRIRRVRFLPCSIGLSAKVQVLYSVVLISIFCIAVFIGAGLTTAGQLNQAKF
jgi:hypothetical protein